MAKKDKKTIDLPDVSDIPGQEHVRPPRLGELADTTPSSADEEGDDILDSDDDLLDDKSNVTPDERKTLAGIDTHRAYSEDVVISESALDETDNDGDPLNEGGFGRGKDEDVDGEDLDVPEGDDDPIDEEEIGEGDEENSEYSTDKNEDDSDIDYDV